MLYKIEGKTAGGKRWVRLFDGTNEPYTPIKNELTRHGYSHATAYPPKPMEFWMSAQTGFESKPQARELCYHCKGEHLIRVRDNAYMGCPVCGMEGFLYGTQTINKNLDKLIEDLNL